jgi:hypothetical protein|tara:strand:+ start:234 stop:620 length:387 start_codon:yes stop_codon:yes gene_type:complete
MTPKAEKDALWKDLKLQWSFLKRDSGADEVKKGEAKKRINEIQESLKLEKTNWDAPRQGAPGSHLTNAGASPTPSNNALVEKILGTLLDMKRETNESIVSLTQKINSLEEKVLSGACNCAPPADKPLD